MSVGYWYYVVLTQTSTCVSEKRLGYLSNQINQIKSDLLISSSKW